MKQAKKAKRKTYQTGQLVRPTLVEAIEDAYHTLQRACECDGRGCRYCISADNLSSVAMGVEW